MPSLFPEPQREIESIFPSYLASVRYRDGLLGIFVDGYFVPWHVDDPTHQLLGTDISELFGALIPIHTKYAMLMCWVHLLLGLT